VRHDELEDAREEARLARRLPDLAGLDARNGEKTRQEHGVGRHEAERGDGQPLGCFGVHRGWAGCVHGAAVAQRLPVGQAGLPFVNQIALMLWRIFQEDRRASGVAGGESLVRDRLAMPKKVMIVEDNELNMKLFRDLIEASGYETVRTRNGLEALDLARAHRPDLILMDIQLPEVSGLEVTKWLKEDDELHSIPVIAVTAFAMKGDEERIRQGGCEAYISKPISVARFIETIKSYLGDA